MACSCIWCHELVQAEQRQTKPDQGALKVPAGVWGIIGLAKSGQLLALSLPVISRTPFGSS